MLDELENRFLRKEKKLVPLLLPPGEVPVRQAGSWSRLARRRLAGALAGRGCSPDAPRCLGSLLVLWKRICLLPSCARAPTAVVLLFREAGEAGEAGGISGILEGILGVPPILPSTTVIQVSYLWVDRDSRCK